jgi:hypothetical protein
MSSARGMRNTRRMLITREKKAQRRVFVLGHIWSRQLREGGGRSSVRRHFAFKYIRLLEMAGVASRSSTPASIAYDTHGVPTIGATTDPGSSTASSRIKRWLLFDLRNGTKPLSHRCDERHQSWTFGKSWSRWRAVPTRMTWTFGPSPTVLE